MSKRSKMSKKVHQNKPPSVVKQSLTGANAESKSEIITLGVRRKKNESESGKVLTIDDEPRERSKSQLSMNRRSVLLDPSMPSSININLQNSDLDYSLDLVKNTNTNKSPWQSNQNSTMPLAKQIRPHRQPMSTKSFQNTLEEIDIRQTPTAKRQSKESTFTQHKFLHERQHSIHDSEGQELIKSASSKSKDKSEEGHGMNRSGHGKQHTTLGDISEEQENSTPKTNDKNKSKRKPNKNISEEGENTKTSKKKSKYKSKDRKKRANREENSKGDLVGSNNTSNSYSDLGSTSDNGESGVSRNSVGRVQYYNEIDGKYYDIDPFPPSKDRVNGATAIDAISQAWSSIPSLLQENDASLFQSVLGSSQEQYHTTTLSNENHLDMAATQALNTKMSYSKMTDPGDGDESAKKDIFGGLLDEELVVIILQSENIPQEGENETTDSSEVDGKNEIPINGPKQNELNPTDQTSEQLSKTNSITADDSTDGTEVANTILNDLILNLEDERSNKSIVGGDQESQNKSENNQNQDVTENSEESSDEPKNFSITSAFDGSSSPSVDNEQDIISGDTDIVGVDDSNDGTKILSNLPYGSAEQPLSNAFSGNEAMIVNCSTDPGGNERNTYICDLPPILPNNQSCEASTIDLSFRVRVTNRCRCHNSNCSCPKQPNRNLPDDSSAQTPASKNCVVTLMEPSNDINGRESSPKSLPNSQLETLSANERINKEGMTDISSLDPNLLMKLILNPDLENQLQGSAREAMEQYMAPLTTFLAENLPKLGIHCSPDAGNDGKKRSNKNIKDSMDRASIPSAASEEYLRVSGNQTGNVSEVVEEPILTRLSRFFPTSLPVVLTEQFLELKYHEQNEPNGIGNGSREVSMPSTSGHPVAQHQGQTMSIVTGDGNTNSTDEYSRTPPSPGRSPRPRPPRPWYFAILDGADMLQNEYWGDEE